MMKKSIYKLHNLIIINFILITSIVIVAKIKGYDLAKLLLTDDGYYRLSKNLFEGEAIMPNILAPGLPIIYYPIHFFPESFHPILRLFISFLFSSGIIGIVYYSLLPYLNKKEIFFGSIFFIINPVYAQWTIKSCPEIFVGFFLALFILFLLKVLKSNKLVYFIILCFIFFITFFIKPVFLFIPLPLMAYYLYLRNKRLIIFSIILLFLAVTGFYSYSLNTPKVDLQARAKGEYQYGEYLMISSSLWINWVVKTKQFYKPTIKPYEIPGDLDNYFPVNQLWLYENISPKAQLSDATLRYVVHYYRINPKGNIIGLNLQFILDYPGLFIQKLLFSPLFFIGMSAHGTFIKLFYNLIFLILGVFSIIKITNESNRIEIVSIGAVLFGYAILYLLTHVYDRYSLPILPWLIIWSGYTVSLVGSYRRNAQ